MGQTTPHHHVAPDRTLAQRMAALQEANRIRTRRAQLKRDLKAGRRNIADLLLEPPEWLETAKVAGIILAVPKIGRSKVNRILSQAAVSPSKTVAGLTHRQRIDLVGAIARRGLRP